jgi:hypothetical protein
MIYTRRKPSSLATPFTPWQRAVIFSSTKTTTLKKLSLMKRSVGSVASPCYLKNQLIIMVVLFFGHPRRSSKLGSAKIRRTPKRRLRSFKKIRNYALERRLRLRKQG